MAMYPCLLKPNLTFPTLTGSIVTFNSQYAGLPLKSHKIALTATQSGSGTPSPDNVRTINGYSAINIGSDAKYAGFINFNQLSDFPDSANWQKANVTSSYSNGELTVVSDSNNTIAKYTYPRVFDSSIYYVRGYGKSDGVAEINIGAWQGNGGDFPDTVGTTWSSSTSYVELYRFVKMTSSSSMVGARLRNPTPSGNYGVFKDIEIFDLTAMFGQTKAEEIFNMEQQTAGSGVAYFRSLFPNDYYAYNAGTLTTVSAVNGSTNSFFTINLGGTYYFGEYDARTGVFKATHGFDTYDGSADETWDAFNIDLRMGVRGRTTANKSYVDSNICNIFDNSTSNETYADEANSYTWRSSPYVSNLVFFYVPLSENITSVEQWRTWLSNHPTTICYELATPQTIQLPPCPIDTTGVGVQNIWADTGDTNIQYPKFG